MENENKDLFLDIYEVAEILNVSTVTARKLAGKPDIISSTKYNLPLFHYRKEKILSIAEKRKMKDCCKPCEKCRICHQKLEKEELVGGRCKQCRADLCVANFCQKKCCLCSVTNPDLLFCLKKAIEKMEGNIYAFKFEQK